MLAINQLIKIVIGVVVIAVVIMGLYFFGSYVADFFGNMIGGEEEEKKQGSVQVIDSGKSEAEVSPSPCNKCGEGISNRCDESECLNLGSCNFEWSFFGDLADECTQIK